MRFTTKTEYGLVCLVYMVRNGSLNSVTVKDIVRDEQYPSAYIEKILQSLRVAGIVSSREGSQGGYALTRAPEAINLKDIVGALEGGLFDVFCEPDLRKNITCTHHELCGLKPVWNLTKNTLAQLYGQVTLRMIAENQLAGFEVNLQRSNAVNSGSLVDSSEIASLPAVARNDLSLRGGKADEAILEANVSLSKGAVVSK